MKTSFKIILIVVGYIFFICCVFNLTGCKKQNDCGKVYFITEYYADPRGEIKLSDEITWESGSVVCGQQFENYKIQELRDTIVTAHCENGVTMWYEKHKVKTN